MSRVLVTGASGYLGRKLVRALARDRSAFPVVVATDLRTPAEHERLDGVHYEVFDVRQDTLAALLRAHEIDAVVHLATLVNPGPDTPRSLQFEVDVRGTERVLAACLDAGVGYLVVTSSGAAYGYHADNAPLLTEDAPLRGDEDFAYAHHKRLVEEHLAAARRAHPELAQLVLRPGTILGVGARNQITALFTGPAVLGLRESETPFTFVLDDDVVRVIELGLRERRAGIYNLSGEGVLTLREVARRMDVPYVAVPERVVRGALGVLRRFGATRYGPEQTAFLLHRPVLSSARIRRDWGLSLTPTREVFERWHRSLGR